jgi:hypothetical protein
LQDEKRRATFAPRCNVLTKDGATAIDGISVAQDFFRLIV